MNDEEKKAVEFIRDLITWDVRQYLCPNKEECKNLEILLNLIKKKKKEIDLCEETEIALNNRIMDLEEINKEHQKLNGELRDEIKRQGNTREIEEKYIEENFISKDKIRGKIKELDEKWHVLYRDSEVKDILKELLEEE